MSAVFYVVEGMRFGQGITFYFDSLEAATEFADFAGSSIRTYRPRAPRSIHVAYANTLGTKGWLKQNGINLWPEESEEVEYAELTDEDDNLPF